MEAFFAENRLQPLGQREPRQIDAELGALLVQYIRRTYAEHPGAWVMYPANDRATLRFTCHAAEVLHGLSYDAETNRMVHEAGNWLINLPDRDEHNREDRNQFRLYPSRFKTLASLNRFGDEEVRNDFLALLATERHGLLHREGGSTILDSCVVLETLRRLRELSDDTDLGSEQRCLRIEKALATELNRWRTQSAHAHPSKNATQIDGVQDVSYVVGLLGNAAVEPHINVNARRHAHQQLIAACKQYFSAHSTDIQPVLYAALQLSRSSSDESEEQRTLNDFLSGIRHAYRAGEAQSWDFLAHLLVLRLLIAVYGAAELRANISAHVFRAYDEQRYRDEQGAVKAELRNIITERMSIDFKHVDPIAGGYTSDRVYHVEFEYAFPTPSNRPGPAPMRTTIIVKRSTEDAFNRAVKNYQKLPHELRDLFVRQPSKAQVYKSTDNAAYFLLMEDLTDMDTLHFRLKDWDHLHMSERHEDAVRNAVASISAASFRMFAQTRKSSEHFPSSQLSRLYLSEIVNRSTAALEAIPWLKNPMQRCSVNGTHFNALDYYLQIITRHQHMLSPRYLGLTHGDFHARNIMLDDGCRTVKLIDLDELSWSHDYLADLGTLLENVVVFRRLENPARHYGLGYDKIIAHDATRDSRRNEAGRMVGDGTQIQYPNLVRPATLLFQQELLARIEQHEHAENSRKNGGDSTQSGVADSGSRRRRLYYDACRIRQTNARPPCCTERPFASSRSSASSWRIAKRYQQRSFQIGGSAPRNLPLRDNSCPTGLPVRAF